MPLKLHKTNIKIKPNNKEKVKQAKRFDRTSLAHAC